MSCDPCISLRTCITTTLPHKFEREQGGTKKSKLSGQKNHATSQVKKLPNLSRQKKNAISPDKKIRSQYVQLRLN
jgi:hypothetical protein